MTKLTKAEFREVLGKLVDIAYRTAELDQSLGDELLEIVHSIRGQTILAELPLPQVLQDTVRLLKDCKLNFALIGGMAVNVHGEPRGTDDVDVLVSELPPETKTLDAEYMAKFNFRKKASRTGKVITLDHKNGQVELLVAEDRLSKWALKTEREEMVLSTLMPVVSPEALIALKVRVIRLNPKREAKDRADIVSVFFKKMPRPNMAHARTLLTETEKKLFDSIVQDNGAT